MNARKHVFNWIAETLMFFGIYSILCFFMPDVWLYHYYTRNFEFITEMEWSDNYIFVLFIVSFLLNIIVIYSRIDNKKHVRNFMNAHDVL